MAPPLLLLKALMAECIQNLRTVMKRRVTFRVKPSHCEMMGWDGEQNVSLMALVFDGHS